MKRAASLLLVCLLAFASPAGAGSGVQNPASAQTVEMDLFQRAQLARETGRLSDAVRIYQELLVRFPDGPYADAARLALGTTLLDAGQANQALVHFQRLDRNGRFPGSREPLYRCLDKLGGLEAEMATLEVQYRSRAAVPLLFERLVEVLNYGGKAERAADVYEEEARRRPDAESEGFRRELASVLLKAGRLERASALYGALLARSPDDPALIEALGRIRYQQGKTEDALKVWDRISQLDSGRQPGLLFHHLGILRSCGLYAEALAVLRARRSRVAYDPQIRIEEAALLEVLGRAREGADLLVASIESDPGPRGLFEGRLSEMAQSETGFAAVRAALEAATGRGAASGAALYRTYSRLLLEHGEGAEALRAVRAAAPPAEAAAALFELAQNLRNAGAFATSLRAIDEALARPDAGAIRAPLDQLAAEVALAVPDLARAEASLLRLTEAQDAETTSRAALRLARLRLEARRPADARAVLAKVSDSPLYAAARTLLDLECGVALDPPDASLRRLESAADLRTTRIFDQAAPGERPPHNREAWPPGRRDPRAGPGAPPPGSPGSDPDPAWFPGERQRPLGTQERLLRMKAQAEAALGRPQDASRTFLSIARLAPASREAPEALQLALDLAGAGTAETIAFGSAVLLARRGETSAAVELLAPVARGGGGETGQPPPAAGAGDRSAAFSLAPHALRETAELCARAGDARRAASLLEDLAARHPKHPLAPEALFRGGGLALSAGDAARARALLKRLLETYPEALRTQEAREALAKIGDSPR